MAPLLRALARLPPVALVALLSLGHLLALYTFTRGFITTRVELPHVSTCADFPQGPPFARLDVPDVPGAGAPVAQGANGPPAQHPAMRSTCWTGRAGPQAAAAAQQQLLQPQPQQPRQPQPDQQHQGQQPVFDRVVVLIIDALRADFYFAPPSAHPAAPTIRNYSLAMPRLHSLVHRAVRALAGVRTRAHCMAHACTLRVRMRRGALPLPRHSLQTHPPSP